MFEKILENVTKKAPLVHSITNYVTVNDCANTILACGASPIMADDENEVEEITSICNSLVINIGTLNKRTINSMLKAGKKANELNHPVILDPVGAGASALRTETALNLLKNVKFAVIRGNISEIKAIYKGSNTTKGVDADASDAITEKTLKDAILYAKDFSKKINSIIAITGAIDIIADANKAYAIRNGNALMSKITGTGCMLTAMIGAFCGANTSNMLDATAAAVSIMGLSGELAFEKLQKTDGGISTYRTFLIDYIYKMNIDILNGGIKIESM